MKKIAFIVIALAFAAFSLPSCKKCKTCTLEYTLNGVKYTNKYPKECGSKKYVKGYQTDIEAAASVYPNSTVTCLDD